MYVYATLFYYHWLSLIHDLLIRAPRHLPYGLIDQAERVDHLGLTRAHFSNLRLQRFNLLLVLLKADLIDQSIYLFFLLLRGIMNDWLRIYQILIFFNDLLLNLMYFFVLGKSHLRLFFQHLYEFIVHYH